ncbi:MAG: sensor histidine kinase [Saprospiraceae bacterium]
MLKNTSPTQLAYYAAFIIAATQLLALFLLQYFGLTNLSPVIIALLTLVSLLTSFILILFTIRLYFSRRIKLIYKNIHQLKSGTNAKMPSLEKEDVEKVEKEVKDWAYSQQEKINTLNTLEEYRRNFMGDISHELRTPIFNMQGYVHTLLEGGLYDESINLKYLRKAATNIERLQTIVNDLEEISKLETGQLRLDLEVFDIQKLVLEVFDDLEMKSQRNEIRLALRQKETFSIPVRGDREKIRQVLNNLIINSIKYGKKGGTTAVDFFFFEDGIMVEVADNGIGIDETHLNHLFDRFYRVDKSRSRLQGGSGLGLSIVKHILEAHQQTIDVKSKPKVGSTFSFSLAKP